MSFFGNFLFTIFMLQGVSMTSAATAGVILSTLPAVVALLGWLVLGERLAARGRAAVLLAVAGVAVLALGAGEPGAGGGSVQPGTAPGAGTGAGDPGATSMSSPMGAPAQTPAGTAENPGADPGAGAPGGTSPHSLAGALFVLACVFCEAVYVILGKRLTATMPPMRISAAINLIGLVLMTPFGLAQARGFDFGALGAGTWALLVFYALSASVFSTVLWLSGLERVPAGHAGVFTIAMPLAASAVGIVWLGEPFGAAHAVALACAATGIGLIARPLSGTR